MKGKVIYLALGIAGLALLLTGCTGLFSSPRPEVKAPVPAVPGDPRARPEVDPEFFGQAFVRGDHIPGQLVVGYTDEAALFQVLSLVDGQVIDSFSAGEFNAALVELPGGMSVAHAMGTVLLATRRETIPGLNFVEPNYMYKLIDPEPLDDSFLKSVEPKVYDPDADLRPYQWGLDVIGAEDAWAHATGAGITVAVVDTGVDGTHPDLAGKVITGYAPRTNELLLPNADSDHHGHGTHVAGIIAAHDDGRGIVGLAPDVLIMPIRIFEYYIHPTYGYGFWYVGAYYAARGIIWAVDNGADVLNNSWGGPIYSQLIKAAFDYALANGVIPVCAAGNDGEAWIHFPSAYPGVIAVGATMPDDTVTSFSTLGGWLSVAAPGDGILSCVPTWYVQDGTGDPLMYDYWGGTSMATPFVSALAALLRELYPAASPYQIKKMIEDTAVDIEEPGFDIYSGYGRIDAASAVVSPLPDEGASLLVYTPTASSILLYGDWFGAPWVDVVLLKDGEVRYWAQTDFEGWLNFGFPYEPNNLDSGVAPFFEIEPGTYEVLVGGDDQVLWWARTANRVTTSGTVTLGPGDVIELIMPINTELEVRIKWTGAGDVDLAIWEGAWWAGDWSTPKTGADWGVFSPDDDGADGDGTESYTLFNPLIPGGAPHWDYDTYFVGIDATNSTVDTIVTVTVIQNGVEETYGPYLVPAGAFGDLGMQVDWWDALGGPWVY
ncbi:S8 family serine peptidase [Candidatus Bipolaricaulota sp. J31]